MSKYNEPYILSFAVDGNGANEPRIDFNFEPFYKVRPGDTVEMMGDGFLLYGPAQPGEFVALSVIVAESDKDVREKGTILKEFVQSKAVDLGIKSLIAANAGASAILAALKELTVFVSGLIEKNGDDKLLTYEGTFLRDTDNPYHINRKYSRKNDYVNLFVQIIPLENRNRQGKATERILLP
jgi:hypothetical protein